MDNATFNLKEFIKESKDVLINPKSYFSAMRTSGGLAEPIIKAVIYGTIAGVFALIWSLLHIGEGSMFRGAVGATALVWAIIGAIIGLFIGAVILLVISSICKGNTDFEANARVTAAVMVLMPINALLAFTTGINIYFGAIVSLAVNVFAIWLLYNGLIEALKSKPGTTKIVSYILIVLFVILMFASLGAKKKANQFINEYNSSDFKELMENINKK